MRLRPVIVSAIILTLSLSAFASDIANREVGDLGEVGTVHFPITCDPAVQDDFNRGMALLHSFFYLEARNVFSAIAEKDPDCAMAHWGVAMSYYHPLWRAPSEEDLALGQAAVDRAVAAGNQNEREAAYVQAIKAYYKGLDEPQEIDPHAEAALSCHALTIEDDRGRAGCFRREMEKVAKQYPDDVDANAFFALSLLGTAPPGDPTLTQQQEAAAILQTWYESNPNHPGLAHYLIHSYDFPSLAERGLPMAQAYADIAPWVPHALHMPSHIFTRMGMWEESIESNIASAAAARRYEELNHPGAASFEELHALDYLAYGYLQTAQDEKAKAVMDRLDEIDKTYPEVDFAAAYAFGAIPARYTLERRQWEDAANLTVRPMAFWEPLPFAEGHIIYAKAIGAAMAGDIKTATKAANRLGKLADAASEPRMRFFATQMQQQREAAMALVALSEGNHKEALTTLAAVAAREDSLGKHPVSPGAMFPVRELLGEALLVSGDHQRAFEEFTASLELNPRRFNGVYGAARSAEAAGLDGEAKKYYAQLIELSNGNKDGRPELIEAQEYLSRH